MSDLISRQAAINSQVKMVAHGLDWVPVYHLEQLPSAERRGRWILGGEIGFPKWTCTVCGGSGRGDYKICPWCGARMEGEEE